MTGRRGGGRGRPHRGRGGIIGGVHSPRRDDRERRTGWDVAPPSRYLWVGNLSRHATERDLSEQFLRFGDLDSIAHVPGRNYAFVNFRKEDDAAVALRGLQGFNLAGMPLKIEFSKGDRAPVSSHVDEHPRYKRGRSTERGDSLLYRDSRSHHVDPERSYDNSKENKSSEPSEMLWIGFPSFLNVDEVALRRAFSPFGEIEKITVFSGRSYAFVQYRSVVAACRAKEALQGKLFNNPRVNICFAKSDSASAEHGRSSTSTFSPPFRSNFHPGLSGQGVEPFRRERSFDSPIGEFHMASPGFLSHTDRISGDHNITASGRNSSLRTGAGPGANFSSSFEHVGDVSQERRISENRYERHEINPALEMRAPWNDLPFERPHRVLFEDSWEVEDGSFPLPKKPKTDSFPDKELPEYPFSDTLRENQDTGLPKFFPNVSERHHAYDRNLNSVPSGYKGVSDSSRNLAHPHAESDDPWRASDGFKPGPGSLPLNPVKLEKNNPEPHQSLLVKEWKWEGTIAKSGTPVCRARCFPVGKVLDFILPKFLNCTARTGLDMLAKHYYQAASTWVVFFVPETDDDIVFYNDFMHYLGEKQRAAVAKLGERMTLFLVPPSEFSEQVLKVPGKVSISGVILQFQQSSSNYNSLHHPPEPTESKLPSFVHGPTDGLSFHEDTSFRRPNSPDLRSVSQGPNYFSSSSGLVAPVTSNFPPPQKLGNNLPYSGHVPPMGKVPDFHGENRQDHIQNQDPKPPSNWSDHIHQNTGASSFPPPSQVAASHSYDNSMVEAYPFANSMVQQGTTSSTYASEIPGAPSVASKFLPQQDAKPPVPSSLPISLQPGQLAQLAALLGQQKQSGKETILSTHGTQPNLSQNFSSPPWVSMPSGSMAPHISQMQQTQHYSSSASGKETILSTDESQPSLLQNHSFPPQVSVPSGSGVSQFSQIQQLQHHSSAVSSSQFSHPQQLQQPYNISAVSLSQGQQLPQHASSVSTVQPIENSGQQNNQEASSSTREETEADPQKRLQATLQLAAALLQQIQQQAKTADQR